MKRAAKIDRRERIRVGDDNQAVAPLDWTAGTHLRCGRTRQSEANGRNADNCIISGSTRVGGIALISVDGGYPGRVSVAARQRQNLAFRIAAKINSIESVYQEGVEDRGTA